MGYADLHSHLLAGLDDGPASASDSLELACALVELGFDTLCATPHQRLGLYTPDLEAVQRAAETLRKGLAGKSVSATVVTGAENCWDDLLFERSRNGEIPCYADTRTFLFDLPGFSIPTELTQYLYKWRIKGFVPVLGHVERYGGTPDLSSRLSGLAEHAVLTMNLDAVGGGMGRSMARIARKLLKDGRIHALTTDIHDASALDATADGIRWVIKHLGPETAQVLLSKNPRTALAGRLPE